MLTDSFKHIQTGRLNLSIHLPSTSKLALMDFIAEQLPGWRDHPDRPTEFAETTLTEHLCDYLNGVANFSTDWSHVQFRTETGDESRAGRKIDLSVKPRGVDIFIEGRRHTQFQALFPIECKRLPTPPGKDRDEREYVFTKNGTTGGIQRFKLGLHGASHSFAAMIGYVQGLSFSYWLNQINGWIHDLSLKHKSAWSGSDALKALTDDPVLGISTLHSSHDRKGLGICEVRHVWISMIELHS